MTEKRKAAGGVPEPRIDGRVEGWKGKTEDAMAVALERRGFCYGVDSLNSSVSAP